jgi:polar amino acid transport system substrate-binding protein
MSRDDRGRGERPARAATMTPRIPAPSPTAVAALAPAGVLRAAINLGNPLLAARDDTFSAPRGVSVDLADALARRLGVPLEAIPYDTAGKVVDGVAARAWDVAFLAIDPARAVDIAYTAPYVIIEGVYVVRESSVIERHADVDRRGVRVVVGAGSAYDLHLSRTLKHATVVRVPTSSDVIDAFIARAFDVAAGVRQQIEADMRRIHGLRIVGERFMAIEQAMGTPRDRDAAGVTFLHVYVEAMKASGYVAHALARHGIDGVAVAPPA